MIPATSSSRWLLSVDVHFSWLMWVWTMSRMPAPYGVFSPVSMPE